MKKRNWDYEILLIYNCKGDALTVENAVHQELIKAGVPRQYPAGTAKPKYVKNGATEIFDFNTVLTSGNDDADAVKTVTDAIKDVGKTEKCRILCGGHSKFECDDAKFQ